MDKNTYFTDHWQDIEPARIARYEQMFQWRDEHAAMLQPLQPETGCRILDYGCCPGFVSMGLAEVVGETGHVYGVDLNAQFVADSARRAEGKPNVTFHQTNGYEVPLDDGAVHRVFCKNVLEYVADPAQTLDEFKRVLAKDGRMLLIDSDWRFVLVEPWGQARTERFFEAAAIAFKTPTIGRALRALVQMAGFEQVEVSIRAGVDTTGGSLAVIRNMASYIAEFERLPHEEVDEMLAELEAAIESGKYMFSLPQFFITASRP